MSLQMLYTYLPLSNRLFETAPIEAQHWLLILPVTTAVFVLVELAKRLVRWMSRATPSA